LTENGYGEKETTILNIMLAAIKFKGKILPLMINYQTFNFL